MGFEMGDPVHIKRTGSDKYPPFAAHFTYVGPDGLSFRGAPMVQIYNERTGNTYRVAASGIMCAVEFSNDTTTDAWMGWRNKQRDPAGWNDRWLAYQASSRLLTPTEIEAIKQDGLKRYWAKQDA
jgi:hypothetical protein